MPLVFNRNNCPGCNSKPLPDDDQPYPGTHAFSIKYGCGAQIVFVIGGDYWEWEKNCPEMKITNAEIDDGK